MGFTPEMAAARARGMKLVVVDPVLSHAASLADEWVPIRPGTDSALALALMREWVAAGTYDRDFLRRYTNAPYLLGPDGRYARDPESGKPLLWDRVHGLARPFDEVAPDDSALEGAYSVGGVPVRPAFESFREHLEPYTPDHVAAITTVPAATIRRMAAEMAAAAQIGQTTTLEGHTLPLRPAAACWYRGVSAHRHSMLNGMAMGQLDVLLGAVDVPGGLLNASGAGPDWMPAADPDGLITSGNPYASRGMRSALPRRAVKAPETFDLIDLFPVSVYARAMMWLGILERERFGIEYRPEVLIQTRSNTMATAGDPVVVAQALREIPFICCINTFFDETSQFADLLLPDTHALERLVPLVHNPYHFYQSTAMPSERYAWNFQQPVVKAVEKARNWVEVLLEAAERLEVLPDLYSTFNEAARLRPPYRLERDRHYTWEEMSDRATKSVCGDEHGLDYFREHGYYQSPVARDAQAAYPRSFHGARIPLYLEHFIDAGEAVRSFTEARDITWDTSDYTPLVDWKPCLRDEDTPPGFDLWVVNQKLPFMSFSFATENPWLVDLATRSTKVFTVGINTATARSRGLADGDAVVLETPAGKRAVGVARLTEGVHPECLAVPGVHGLWAVGLDRGRGKGIHFNSLLSYSTDRMDMVAAALDACIKVRLRRATRDELATIR
jgi:molybdopterin-containing oxidoreductase family molybdopterin binding subunit